ncbi:hypothetical protein PM3016_1453 [Paenibacillus mucilaginosus 3016]|uniref:Uncharacterized protein n=1 Tax=Paenibacillus mucilaginosus 3016 TaxID=1116391 RepID=H6NGT6_9BACL|nr:hypothetical protein [Paenibacillus mucilaginosus]AFC28378.1 hypothetical protein PM3016_1453 [Paenibacillus mucilaginosus 3016]
MINLANKIGVLQDEKEFIVVIHGTFYGPFKNEEIGRIQDLFDEEVLRK